jgi:hypothetical protein
MKYLRKLRLNGLEYVNPLSFIIVILNLGHLTSEPVQAANG